MSSLWFYSDPIDRLHQENAQFLTLQRFMKPPENKRPQQMAMAMAMAREAENRVMERIQEMGYHVSPTYHNRLFDLWVEGIRVEVKVSGWHESPKGGRYQARIHHFNADVVVFDCVNPFPRDPWGAGRFNRGAHHYFVMPMADVKPHKNLAIWNYDPSRYVGRWMPYLEAWEHITEAVQAACRMWQPPLFTL